MRWVRRVPQRQFCSVKKLHIRTVASKCQSIHKISVLHFHGAYCVFSIIVFQVDVRVCKSQGLNLGPFSWRTSWPSQRNEFNVWEGKKRMTEGGKRWKQMYCMSIWERGEKAKAFYGWICTWKRLKLLPIAPPAASMARNSTKKISIEDYIGRGYIWNTSHKLTTANAT